VIDLGNNEKNLGTSFVQLSRFKNINDFLIQPLPFDRLTNIKNSIMLAPRIAEKTRLKLLTINTQTLFKHLMPKKN